MIPGRQILLSFLVAAGCCALLFFESGFGSISIFENIEFVGHCMRISQRTLHFRTERCVLQPKAGCWAGARYHDTGHARSILICAGTAAISSKHNVPTARHPSSITPSFTAVDRVRVRAHSSKYRPCLRRQICDWIRTLYSILVRLLACSECSRHKRRRQEGFRGKILVRLVPTCRWLTVLLTLDGTDVKESTKIY